MLCPEEGGPYLVKPLFFGSVLAWAAAPHRDGFVLEKTRSGVRMRGRFGGTVVTMERDGNLVQYSGDGFNIALDPSDVAATVTAHEYASIAQMCGSMSYQAVPDTNAYERGNYMKVLSSFTLKGGIFDD